jgi:hypothetical protein
MASLLNENASYQGVDGLPIVDGYIYIGESGKNPKTNPITIYADREQQTPLDNPQRTDAYGRSVNKIWVSGCHSLQVDDNEGVQQLIDLNRGESASIVTITLNNVQGVNAVTADASPAISSYQDKAIYVLTVQNTNTGAVTLDAGVGAKPVKNSDGLDLAAGDWLENSIQRVIYNQANDWFEMLTQSTSEITARISIIESQIENTLIPIGVPFPVFGHLSGVNAPSNNGAAKYVRLTANHASSGGYNYGLLGNESVSGTSPELSATAEVILESSPLYGEVIPLINTSKRYLRPGVSGITYNSRIKAHSHTVDVDTSRWGSGNGSGFGFGNDGQVKSITRPKTTVDGDSETAPRTIEASYYMRIL